LPEIGKIQSTNFQSLLTDLGISRNNVPFALRSEVTPVVLVGGTVSFLATPTPAYGVTDIFTGGLLIAPLALTVLADTGQLQAGAYSLNVQMMVREANFFAFQWRDAANTASLWDHRFLTVLETPNLSFGVRLNIENNNERFRVLNINAGAGGIEYQVSLLARI
jgi:hypothetical protein